ncbi:MAG: 50S ribosomal protein L25/general stress protein Ctc [Porticoccus sp.]|jgi:large subunit ribosomal protein L25|nr:50S ribosomal protein L25/general stress protein Ctc [Porticoccus sp.]
MSNDFKLNVIVRDDTGKGASRRLRRLAGEVPAIVYGGKTPPQKISLPHKDLDYALQNEAFYSHIITLNIEGKNEEVILKDLQRHPAKPVIMHADFLRISKTQKLSTKVPIHFINEDVCAGVKLGGGNITRSMTELDITCLPADLPEYIEVDVAEVEVGQILHISDIKLPNGVESIALSYGEDRDSPIFTVNKPKEEVEEVIVDEDSEETVENENKEGDESDEKNE